MQERQQKPKNQYIMEENTMLKINGYEANYEHLFIYDGEIFDRLSENLLIDIH